MDRPMVIVQSAKWVGYRLEDLEIGVWFLAVAKIFLFSAESRPALGPTNLPIHWVPRALSTEIIRRERDVDQLFPSKAEVKNVWSYASTPPKAWCLTWAALPLLANYICVSFNDFPLDINSRIWKMYELWRTLKKPDLTSLTAVLYLPKGSQNW
jgi:hypothetical protein